LHPRDRQLEGNAVTPTLTTTTSPAPPAAGDRCDRCNAQAKIRVVLPGGGDLVFCGHHAREYDTKIREVASEVVTAED
jgi:Zn ribbon nucleic-acid-binding protein